MIIQGFHVYINIANYNEIILDEENSTNRVTKSIHALDTFFSEIERFGNIHFPNSFVIEKITGSRLHFYVTEDIQSGYSVVKHIVAFAYKLSKCINYEIGKYKNLKDFIINVGCDYGYFYDFEFKTESGYIETTTIGYSANYAAKLQALSDNSCISVSKEIYDSLRSNDSNCYELKTHPSLHKYQQQYYYSSELSKIYSPIYSDIDKSIDIAKDYANSVNLSEIDFSSVRKMLNYSDLSKTNCKYLNGIPVFADVRGFTSQFNKDDINLDEMYAKTKNVLSAMYEVSTKYSGIHVQFQGDRELSLYHNVPGDYKDGVLLPDKKCFKNAVLGAMRMIDAVKPYQLNIGVGADFGRLFATKIGVRGSKDNILIGETVIVADYMEDSCADKDQIAITESVYNGLLNEDSVLASMFQKTEDYYVTTVGYKEYIKEQSYSDLDNNTQNGTYNGAWKI